MLINFFYKKIKDKIWYNIVIRLRHCKLYPTIYRSYWHSLFYKSKNKSEIQNYFSAIPNPGAGIGHQIANWIAGYWFAKQFGLKFAHIPFSNQKWEGFLGFGEDEIKVASLLKKGYIIRKLPLFDENNQREIDLNKSIIQSYNGRKIIFIAEQDQFYADQFGVMEDIKRKFHQTSIRKNEQLIYSKYNFNIAIHVRRGDIVIGQQNKKPNLLLRWQDNDYFLNVLTNILSKLESDKPIAIYLFSQGKQEDFYDFEKFENINFCLDMNSHESFLHMIYADLLITSKSSFSYKPALLSNGIKVCPKDFWHRYPAKKDWILMDANGHFTNDITVIKP